jgi:glucose-6-phosphate-specific signal transduction histidine kinase
MMNISRRKLLVLVYLAIAACLESIMLYFLFTDISMAGVYNSPVDIDFGPVTIIHLVYNLLVFMISGFWLTINTLRLKDSENRLRGKFLLIAFLLFLVGAILEMIIFNPINRTIVLLAAIIFYIGFTLPEKIKNKIIKT